MEKKKKKLYRAVSISRANAIEFLPDRVVCGLRSILPPLAFTEHLSDGERKESEYMWNIVCGIVTLPMSHNGILYKKKNNTNDLLLCARNRFFFFFFYLYLKKKKRSNRPPTR